MGAQMFDQDSSDHEVIIHKNAEYVFAKGASAFSIPVGDGKTEKGKNHFPAAAGNFGSDCRWVDMTNGKRGKFAAAAGDEGYMTLTLTLSDGKAYAASDATANEKARIRFFWQEKATAEQPATELVISPDRFPGTYRVIGDTLIRSEKTGKDEAFQFVINKAKLLSEVTITMQAEGDPSTFSMTLNVLRDEDGNMMSLRKY